MEPLIYGVSEMVETGRLLNSSYKELEICESR